MGGYTENMWQKNKKAVLVVMRQHGIRLISPYALGIKKELLLQLQGNPVVLIGRKSPKKDALITYCIARELLKIHKYGNLKMDTLSVYPNMEGMVVLVDTTVADINRKHIFYMLRANKSVILDIRKLELQEIFGHNLEYIEEGGMILDVDRDKVISGNTPRQRPETVSFAE